MFQFGGCIYAYVHGEEEQTDFKGLYILFSRTLKSRGRNTITTRKQVQHYITKDCLIGMHQANTMPYIHRCNPLQGLTCSALSNIRMQSDKLVKEAWLLREHKIMIWYPQSLTTSKDLVARVEVPSQEAIVERMHIHHTRHRWSYVGQPHRVV